MSKHKSSGQVLKPNQYRFVSSVKNVDILRILDETPAEKNIVIVDTFLRHESYIPEQHCRFIFIRATAFTKYLINTESPIINEFLDQFQLELDNPEFYWAEIPVTCTDEHVQEVVKQLSELIADEKKFATIVSLY